MKPAQAPDEWLMEQVARDRRDSLAVLIRRYANPILTFLVRMTRDQCRSEDLFQEVFLAVWIKRRQFDRYRRFKPWLYRIAVNKCRASLRRRSITMHESSIEDPSLITLNPNPSPVDSAVAVERAFLVESAVASLPEKQRVVLALRVWSTLSFSEIAELLGRTEATVRSNMHHALAGLRTYLEPRME